MNTRVASSADKEAVMEKLTKKQLAAMERIMEGETKQRPHAIVGAHPSGERYIITDGYSLIALRSKPDGLSEAPREDTFDELLRKSEDDGKFYLVENMPNVAELRKMPGRIKLTAKKSDGSGAVSSVFDVRLLVNVLEACGTGCLAYLGYAKPFSEQFASLLVYPKTGCIDPSVVALLLPCRW